MPSFHSKYICQQCGYESTGWLGKCPECGTWNSLVETVVEVAKAPRSGGKVSLKQAKTQSLNQIKAAATKRIFTKIPELDRVLGGGLVPGQVVLVAGEPGIGKSTILLQLADKLGEILYVCGEESVGQIAVRAKRLGIKNQKIQLLEETNADMVVNLLTSTTQKFSAVVVDSIQTMTTDDLSGLAGSVGQVRECAFRFLKAAKQLNIPLFLVGHVTKEGTVAGPAVLAHIVDTVLWFEGDKTLTLRLLRAVKNRFGPTDEVGIFEMVDHGLISVSDAEKLFLEKYKKQVPGSVVTSILSGSRPILVEIQALVVGSKMAFPKRVAQGVDSRRLELILAVLIRRCSLPLYDFDVFVNVAGGIKVEEPGADLAIALAIASAYFDKPISAKTVAVGEIGLLGEIREVVSQEKRVKEAKRIGFSEPATSKEFKYIGQVIKVFLK
jgi:DNA repair protein RadA/Sms